MFMAESSLGVTLTDPVGDDAFMDLVDNIPCSVAYHDQADLGSVQRKLGCFAALREPRSCRYSMDLRKCANPVGTPNRREPPQSSPNCLTDRH